MSYADELAKLNRTKITLVKITLGYCSRTYGVAPCVPLVGSDNCYNTFKTCVDDGAGLPKANYGATNRSYKFSNAELPPPFNDFRPYFKSWDSLGQEIKDSITVKNKTTIELFDDYGEADITNDPYWSTRGHSGVTVPGSYFKRLFARNNYRYKSVKVYYGFSGMAEADYELQFTGLIEDVYFERGIVKLVCVDNLKSLELAEIDAPRFAKLAQDIGYNDTGNFDVEILNDTAATISGSCCLMVDDEIIYYTTKTGSTINCVLRGVWGTTQAPHSSGAELQVIQEFNGSPAFLLAILASQAGLVFDSSISDASLIPSYLQLDLSCLIAQDKVKISELFWEIVDQFGFKVWGNKDGSLGIKRTMNFGGLATPPTFITDIPSLSDDANFLKNSVSVDLNEKSRITRIIRYWNLRSYSALRKLPVFVSSGDTTIRVNNLTDLPDEGEVKIELEFISYTGTTTTPYPAITGCTRGAKGTTPDSHAAGLPVYQSDLSYLKDFKKADAYEQSTITYDANAETEIGKSEAKTFYSRWFNYFTEYLLYHAYIGGYGTYIDTMDSKMLASMVEPKIKVSFSTEIKDDTVSIGDFINLSCDDVNEIDGAAYNEVMFQVIKKEPTDKNEIKFVAEKIISLD